MAGGFDIGSVFARIKLETKDFKRGISEAKKGMAGFKQSATRSLTAVRNASLVASAAIGVVGVATFNLAKEAGKYESIRAAFVGMTDGMGISVDDFQRRVADASRNTIDDLTILTNANKALALIGKESFEDFGKDFESMAALSKKAARATGQDVDFMFDSLVTGIARESKLILDNLGITVDLTKAKDDYAESLGKVRDELTETEAKSAVLNAVLGKLDEQYKDVDVSSGGFSGALMTLTTTIKNLKIAIGTELLPIFNEWVRKITPVIKEYGPKLIETVKGVVGAFGNLSPKIQLLIVGLVAAIPVIAVISGLLLLLAPVIGALISPITLVVAAIVAWFFIFKRNIEIAKEVFEMYKESFNAGMEVIKGVLESVADTFVSIFNKIKSIVEFVGSIILNIIKAKMAGILAVVKPHLDFLKDLFTIAFNLIKTIVKVAGTIIVSIVKGKLEWLLTTVKNYLEDVKDTFESKYGWILKFLKNIGGQIMDAITAPIRKAYDKVKGYIDAIKMVMDFTRRQSPSIIDLINKSIREVDRAFRKMDFTSEIKPTVKATSITNAAAPKIANVSVNLDGALVGNIDEASELGERIGNSIIKRLNMNVRY